MKLNIPTIKIVVDLYNHNNTTEKNLCALSDFPYFNELIFKFLNFDEYNKTNGSPSWSGDVVNLLKIMEDDSLEYIIPFNNIMRSRIDEADNINHSLQKSTILAEHFSTEQLQSYIHLDNDQERLSNLFIVVLELDKLNPQLNATYTFIHTLEQKNIKDLLYEILLKHIKDKISHNSHREDIRQDILNTYDHLINTIDTDYTLKNYLYNDNIINSLTYGVFAELITKKHHKIIKNIFENAENDYANILKNNFNFLLTYDSFNTNIFQSEKKYTYLIDFDINKIQDEFENKKVYIFKQDFTVNNFIDEIITIMKWHNTYEYSKSSDSLIITHSCNIIDEKLVNNIAITAYKYFLKTFLNKETKSEEEFLQFYFEENTPKNNYNNKLRKI